MMRRLRFSEFSGETPSLRTNQPDMLSLVCYERSRAHHRRGCNTRHIQMPLDKRCEHVCRISLSYCLDEEGLERCTNIRQGLVIPKEQATRIGCYRHVEGGRGDAYLVAEACTMVG